MLIGESLRYSSKDLSKQIDIDLPLSLEGSRLELNVCVFTSVHIFVSARFL